MPKTWELEMNYNFIVVSISLPQRTFYEHHLSKLIKWFYISTNYGLSYHDKMERKATNAKFLNMLGRIDPEIHLSIILQEVRKNLGMIHFLELFRAETNCKTQSLYLKQQYFIVQIELLQFLIEQLWILDYIIFKYSQI